MKKNELQLELKKLTDLGFIEQSQLDKIENDYFVEDNKTVKPNRFFLVFALLGVVFIGGGLISIFAFNWSMFSREIKVVLALAPLLTSQVLLCIKCKAKASDVWIQPLALAMGFSFLAALGLIYQAYQLSYSLTSMLLITFLLMLPVIYLLNAYYLAVFSLLGVLITSAVVDTTYILIVALLLPYYIMVRKKGDNCKSLSMMLMIWALSIPFAFELQGAAFICLMMLLNFAIMDFDSTCKKIAKVTLYFIAFFTSYNFFFLYYLWDGNNLTVLSASLIGFAVFIFYKRYPICHEMSEKLDLVALAVLGGIIILFAIDTSSLNDEMMFGFYSLYPLLTNGFVLALAISKVAVGLKYEYISSAKRYIFVLNAYVVLKIFSSDVGLLAKGVCFIAIGVGFLITNYMLMQRGKRGNELENI